MMGHKICFYGEIWLLIWSTALNYLPFHLHLLDTTLHRKPKLFNFMTFTVFNVMFLGVSHYRAVMVYNTVFHFWFQPPRIQFGLPVNQLGGGSRFSLQQMAKHTGKSLQRFYNNLISYTYTCRRLSYETI